MFMSYSLTGVHCVPVVDDNGDIVNIISQSFLSSFVYELLTASHSTPTALLSIT
jgi:CBS-domain-containing membrane protein